MLSKIKHNLIESIWDGLKRNISFGQKREYIVSFGDNIRGVLSEHQVIRFKGIGGGVRPQHEGNNGHTGGGP